MEIKRGTGSISLIAESNTGEVDEIDKKLAVSINSSENTQHMMDKIEQQLYYHLMTDMLHMWRYTSDNKSRIEAESKGYFTGSNEEALANTIHKYDYFNGELDAFFQTEMNSLSSYIDNRYYKYVDPNILKMGRGLNRKGYPYKIGIEKLSSQDLKELRIQLAIKMEVIDYEKQLYDSLALYANKSIKLIEGKK